MNLQINKKSKRCVPLIIQLSVVVLAMCMVGGCGKDEKPLVQTTFDDYKSAVVSRDGQKAVMQIDQTSIAYYGDIKNTALEAGPEEMARRSFIDRIMVGMVRAHMQPSYLRQLSGAQLFMYAVQEGWIGDDQVRKTEISDIQVNGNSASAAPRVGSVDVPFRYEFVKESGKWKLNITSVFTVVNGALKQAVTQSGMTEDELILMALSQVAKKPIDESIWQKPKP